MSEEELTKIFYELQNEVYKISIFEELAAEIRKMDDSNPKEIANKLRIILLNKRITEEGKKEFESFITDIIEKLPKGMVATYSVFFDTIISNMKSDVEKRFADIIPEMNNEDYKSFHPIIDLLLYALELDISIYDFIKAFNNDYNYNSELKEKGAVIAIDTDAIYNTLKDIKDNNKPRN